MQYSSLIQAIKKEIDFEPKQSDLCKILDITRATMSYRAKADSKFSDDEIEKIEKFYAIKLDKDVSNNSVELDYYPNVFASCGTGTMVFDETKEKMSVTKDMIDNYSTNKTYAVMTAVGQSMQPIINDSDKLIIEKWNGEQIKDHRVYLFRYNDELFIKRLVKNIDQIVCISENPRFDDRVIQDLSNFTLIGEVVGLYRRKM